MLEVDLDGTLRYANPVTRELFPALTAAGSAHPWLADWPAVVRRVRAGQTDPIVRDVSVGGCIYQQVLHFFPADGFVRIYAFDITERHRAEVALRASEERLRLAQQTGQVGVFDLNFSDRTAVWTDERKAIFGLTPDFKPTWQSWSPLVHPQDRTVAEADLRRAIEARRREIERTYRITRPDGGERWLEERATLTYDAAGQPARMVGTSIDITRQKLAQEQRHERERRFRHFALWSAMTLAVSTFLSESAVMTMLALLPPLGAWWSVLLDSTTMLVLISPMLYFFAYRPPASAL